MGIMDTIMTAVCAVAVAGEIYLDVKLLLLIRKTEKWALTLGLYEVEWELLLTAGVTLSFISGNVPVVLLILFYLTELCGLPLTCNYFTPEGMLRVGLKNKSGIDPAKNYSYEYVQGKIIKETLLLYREGAERPYKSVFGIKDPKLISMLNDNYEKHGYENPMLK